ncbi:hypothetical protein [Streptomyces palmae]|uniref:Uncharacterized protein n=1 Tax=Streptomyces palmae TaxID=1701085 RepID=A0A4Z0HC89_9ACTN|nr:hypothetical protein [Streptomyces palmae]TGB13604.1 hypothetical protein E4099_09715 [Streptomyces palmae]
METDTVARFLKALSPATRKEVAALPAEQQRQLADDWEEVLRDDTSLLPVSELDPPNAEHRAAEQVARAAL